MVSFPEAELRLDVPTYATSMMHGSTGICAATHFARSDPDGWIAGLTFADLHMFRQIVHDWGDERPAR